MGQAIVRHARATCVEVSASGDGLRIWGRADVRQGRKIRRPDGTAVEIYGTGRYIGCRGAAMVTLRQSWWMCPQSFGLSACGVQLRFGTAKLLLESAHRAHRLGRLAANDRHLIQRVSRDPRCPAENADDRGSPPDGFHPVPQPFCRGRTGHGRSIRPMQIRMSSNRVRP